jgi:hypothetical protein
MKTDIPLKRLTMLRAADLLPLLGTPDAQVLAVESLELPASATRLDNVLRLWSPRGQEYLHVVEWQGYNDPAVLWRFTGYLAWLGQRHPGTPITGSLIYLTPADDVGDHLRQEVDGKTLLDWHVPCIRLWEQDTATALQSGSLGLTVLSPLMRNATASQVEQAITTIIHEAPIQQRADLLSILGVFAEPLIEENRFVQIVGKEKLMESNLLSYLMEEKLIEIKKEQETTIRHSLQQTLEEMVMARFPQAPITLVRYIRQVADPDALQRLMVVLVRAADLAEFEQALAQAAAAVTE